MTHFDRYQMYLEALRKPMIKLARLEFLYPNDSIWFVLDSTDSDFIQEGSLSVSLNNGVRRTANIVLANDGRYDFDVNKLWFNQKIRLSMGLMLPDGSEYYIPQGVFYIKNPEDTFLPNQRTINLQLVDKWSHLDGSLFGYLDYIYHIPINSNIFQATRELLKSDMGNGLQVDHVEPLFTNYYDGKLDTLPDGTKVPLLNMPYDGYIESLTGTYADVLMEMNTQLVALMGYNANGQLQIDPSQDDVLDTDKPILWNFRLDEPEFLGASYQINNTDIFNDIIVTGTSDGNIIASARVTNRDIRSPYNVQTIGRKTKPRQDTTSEQYTTDRQCQDLGEYLLKRDTIKKMSVSISCSQMFHLYENGLVTLYRPDRQNALERHLITGYSIPMGTDPMTINATSVNDLLTF